MKIALIGYGKMGKTIEEIAIGNGHEVVLKIDETNTDQFTEGNLQKADVAIEFTHPAAAFNNVMKCLDANIPVVSGTTGWLEHLEEARQHCIAKNGSLLYASNFSIGVNIFFALNARLASLMKGQKDYEVKIEETHHVHKKDAPSGTAITLAEAVIESGKKKKFVSGESNDGEILSVISHRIDEVPGTHLVTYFSENDAIDITHTAFNRKGFAAGAVAAAQYIKDRKGIHTMAAVLGIE